VTALRALRAHWLTYTKAPLRSIKRWLTVGALCVVVGSLLAVAWPRLWPLVLAGGLIYVTGALLAIIGVLSRLLARIDDTRAAVSSYANLSSWNQSQGGLFFQGAAANAAFVSFLLRCLDSVRPKSVLELGSGQTTKILARYFHDSEGVYVCTLEHDEDWARRLRPLITANGHCHDYRCAPLEPSEIVLPEDGRKVSVRWYRMTADLLERRFSLLIVDGPNTSGTELTRLGVLSHLPDLLTESFVVIFDDTERRAELLLAKQMGVLLRQAGIPFIRFEIEATKTQSVFCSRDLAFLQSS
jgi:hypothetical protein